MAAKIDWNSVEITVLGCPALPCSDRRGKYARGACFVCGNPKVLNNCTLEDKMQEDTGGQWLMLYLRAREAARG